MASAELLKITDEQGFQKKKLEKSKNQALEPLQKAWTCNRQGSLSNPMEATERGEQWVPPAPLTGGRRRERAAAPAPQKGHDSRDQAGSAPCGGEEEERNEGPGGPGLERKGSAGNMAGEEAAASCLGAPRLGPPRLGAPRDQLQGQGQRWPGLESSG